MAIPDEYKTFKMCIKAAADYPGLIKFMPDKYKTRERELAEIMYELTDILNQIDDSPDQLDDRLDQLDASSDPIDARLNELLRALAQRMAAFDMRMEFPPDDLGRIKFIRNKSKTCELKLGGILNELN